VANQVVQHVIHHGLEGRRSVDQVKWYDQELKVVVVGTKRRLRDVDVMHADLVVATAQVQLGEEARTVKLVEEFIHDQNLKHIVHRSRVQWVIVNTEALGAIMFLHQQHRRGEG
jgi:hypothetical protein